MCLFLQQNSQRGGEKDSKDGLEAGDLPPSLQPQAKQVLSCDRGWSAQAHQPTSAACPCQVTSCGWQPGVFRVPGCHLALHQYPSFTRTRLALAASSHGGRERGDG